ncbi:STAS domain-containing protein [Actinomadura sp. PM05-2]|uniref:STAS domain-containing protein n=1 Tax=Actinomadura parmotrematis TaxID=2864039 RepID=A0ABS7FUQ9_9ACTN|nr:STAS domain-containing protein [Actinomadura parmotrematis]
MTAARPEPDRLVLVLAGELDYGTAGALTARLAAESAGPRPAPAHVTLDLAAVGFCDSIGLNTLVTAWKAQRAAGGVLVVGAMSPLVAEMLEITGLAGTLTGG